MTDDQITRSGGAVAGTSGPERTRIEEIIWCEGQADQAVADAQREADGLRWTAARLITEELATGKTHRTLAMEIGKDQRHVGRMRQVHEQFGDLGPQDGRSFDSYYQEVKRRPGVGRDQAAEIEADQNQLDREFSDIEVVNAFRQYVKFVFTPDRAGTMTELGKKQMIEELEKAIELLKGDQK